MRATQEFQEQVGRIEKLIQKLESSPDPSMRGTARDLIQTLLELHGAGIERMLEIVSTKGGDAGTVIVETLGQDELVSSLLVLHGLHPEDFETRVRRGLDKVRPLLRSRGAHLDVIVVEEPQVILKLAGGGPELEEAVREALYETAPDAADVSIQGAPDRARTSSFVPLTSLLGCNGSAVVLADTGRP